MRKSLMLVVLTSAILTGCNTYGDIKKKHPHEAGETIFFVGFDKNGQVTTVAGRNGKPITDERRIFDRAEHDAFVETLDPDEVEIIPVPDPELRIVLHPGSTCHDMSSGSTTWEECH